MYKKQNVPKKQRSPVFNDYLSIQYNPEDLFTIIDFIGKGAYGTVHKAIHNQTQMTVAIKIISVGSTAQTISLQNETSLMKLCKESDYILKYYGSYFSKKNQEIWIILEYCEGGSAVDLMYAMNQCFNEEEIASIIEMILKGLVSLHNKKLIHRDVKGANILINAEGCAKLGDFGVGVQLDEDENMRHSLRGSPHWMSPQVVSYLDYDYKTDIWSLGITCIELKEGEPPLSNLKAANVLKTIAEDPKQLWPKDNQYTQEFTDFVRTCLTVNPIERPTAKELLQHPFITRFSQGKQCIENLVMYHLDDLEKYRQEQVVMLKKGSFNEGDDNDLNSKNNNNEYNDDKQLIQENDNTLSHNNNNNSSNSNHIQSYSIPENEIQMNNIIFSNNKDVHHDMNIESNHELEGSVIIHSPNNEDSPAEFKKYIDNGKIILDVYDYVKHIANTNNNTKIETHNNTNNTNNTYSNNIIINNNDHDNTITEEDFHLKNESNTSDKTNQYTYSNSLTNINIKYSFLQKYRNNKLNSFEHNAPFINIPSSTIIPHPHIQPPTKIIKTFSINELLQDKEMKDMNDIKLKQKIQTMTTEKNDKLNDINSQYNTEIQKYEYALKLLSQFPNVKSLGEYEMKYLNCNKHNHISNNSYVYNEEEDLKDEDEDDIKKHEIQESTNAPPVVKVEQGVYGINGGLLQSQRCLQNKISNEFISAKEEEKDVLYNTLNVVHTGTFKKHSVYFGCKQ